MSGQQVHPLSWQVMQGLEAAGVEPMQPLHVTMPLIGWVMVDTALEIFQLDDLHDLDAKCVKAARSSVTASLADVGISTGHAHVLGESRGFVADVFDQKSAPPPMVPAAQLEAARRDLATAAAELQRTAAERDKALASLAAAVVDLKAARLELDQAKGGAA